MLCNTMPPVLPEFVAPVFQLRRDGLDASYLLDGLCFDARGCVDDYTRGVHLVAAMLRGGFTAEEAGKIAGGNFLRIFRAAVG